MFDMQKTIQQNQQEKWMTLVKANSWRWCRQNSLRHTPISAHNSLSLLSNNWKKKYEFAHVFICTCFNFLGIRLTGKQKLGETMSMNSLENSPVQDNRREVHTAYIVKEYNHVYAIQIKLKIFEGTKETHSILPFRLCSPFLVFSYQDGSLGHTVFKKRRIRTRNCTLHSWMSQSTKHTTYTDYMILKAVCISLKSHLLPCNWNNYDIELSTKSFSS